jgi:serine/threonine-protein kinase
LRDVLLARGALGVPAALAVLEPVLAGLAEAHRRGLVHRDVKPENVLISRAGAVKVADFGLVTAAAQAGASHAGMILGTVAYLSPEQVTTGSADARSDVYAAGVLAYELLTGTVPFTGDTAISVAYRHVHDEVPPPSALAPGIPAELDDLVVRATRRAPAARPADAAAFLAALCRVAARAGVPRVPPPVPPARSDAADDADRGWAGADPQRLTAAPGPRGTRLLVGGTAWPEPEPEPEPADRVVVRRRSRRLFGVGMAVVATLGLLVGASGWWLGDGRWTTVPQVVGLERAAAERLLTDADLTATVTVAPHDTLAAGLVAAVEPAGDRRLPRGGAVQLTVSGGRPVVPAVAAGTPVAVAEQAVRDAGLEPGREVRREYSTRVPAGAVIRTDPPAGTALRARSEVALVVSRGPEPERQVRVPLLVGRTASAAAATLTELGLDVQVERAVPFDTGPFDTGPFGRDDGGRVVAQSHGAGSLVDPGTTVTLRTL